MNILKYEKDTVTRVGYYGKTGRYDLGCFILYKYSLNKLIGY